MMAGIQQMATPESLKHAKADIKKYSIDHEPIRWAQGHILVSQQHVLDLCGSSGPIRAADKGIEHIEEALKVITEENHAPNFATVQWYLARLYPQRVAGNRTENLSKALACAETALRISKDPSCPPCCVAELHAIIGSLYANIHFELSSSRAANDDLAIRHYLASLQDSSMNDGNYNWADRHMKVGQNGKPRSNVKVAIKHSAGALKVFTKSINRDDWAKTHKYLALSYDLLFNTADRTASLAKMSEEEFAEKQSTLVEKWIASLKNALQVYTPTYRPTSW
jgi:tetratricopeptide (TPR) repeat protein